MGSGNWTLPLWDAERGVADQLHGHQRAVIAVAFEADGRHVVSAGEDSVVRRWTVLEGWLDSLCE